MPSLFTRMMSGEARASLVWADEHCVAVMAPRPLQPGHLLVVPRAEIDDWLDVPPDLLAHLVAVSQAIGMALKRAFPCEKVGIQVIGLEVRHVHVHLVPIDSGSQLRREDVPEAQPGALDESAARVREALRGMGFRPPKG